MPSSRDATGGNASANLDVLRSIAVLMVLLDHLCRHFHRDRVLGLRRAAVLPAHFACLHEINTES